jgi:hypothetical protein
MVVEALAMTQANYNYCIEPLYFTKKKPIEKLATLI